MVASATTATIDTGHAQQVMRPVPAAKAAKSRYVGRKVIVGKRYYRIMPPLSPEEQERRAMAHREQMNKTCASDAKTAEFCHQLSRMGVRW